MRGLRCIAIIGLSAALSAACLLAAAEPAGAWADPSAVISLEQPPPAAHALDFDVRTQRPQPPRVYLLRRGRSAVEAVASRDDAMPVGRLRSFAARYAPWRGTPWVSQQPLRDNDPGD